MAAAKINVTFGPSVDLIGTVLRGLSALPGGAEAVPYAEALRQIVSDWATVQQSLENQLQLSLEINETLNAQVAKLREDLWHAQRQYYTALEHSLNLQSPLRGDAEEGRTNKECP